MKIQNTNRLRLKLISEYFNIEKTKLEELGVFDGFIGLDSKLFVDPFLLDGLEIPVFSNSREKIKNHFSKIIKLLKISQNKNDLAFKEAVKLLTFKEVKGIGIGYGNYGGDGSAVGKKLALSLCETGQEIIDLGIEDPEIFELLGLFQEGYGADRLSDLTISILHKEIIEYTQNVCKKLNITNLRKKYKSSEVRLPYIKELGKCLLFVPKKLLRDLPVALDQENIDTVVRFNELLRSRFNQMIGKEWSDFIKSKSNRKNIFFNDKVALRDLVEHYKNKNAYSYDFDEDPNGELKWKTIGLQIFEGNPLNINLSVNPTTDEVTKVVECIINQFKKNIEFNGVNKLLKKANGRFSEEFCQKVFYVIADSYCNANNLDLSAEINGGRGPVDFKLSNGLKKVVVEIKLTSNSSFLNGIKSQLPIYENSENATGIFLAIQVSDLTSKINELTNLELQFKKEGKKFPKYFIINASIKPSASKKQ